MIEGLNLLQNNVPVAFTLSLKRILLRVVPHNM